MSYYIRYTRKDSFGRVLEVNNAIEEKFQTRSEAKEMKKAHLEVFNIGANGIWTGIVKEIKSR